MAAKRINLNNLLLKVVMALAMIAVVSLASVSTASAQSAVERELIAMFKPEVIELPEGVSSAPLSEIQISSDTLLTILDKYTPELISKAFPEFELSDTLGMARNGGTVRLADVSNIYLLLFPEGADMETIADSLSLLSEVVYAERNNRPIPYDVYPNDPHFQNHDQWGLYNYASPGSDIHAPAAWEITTGSSNTKIGIIDGGVEDWHEDLSGKVSGDAGWGWSGHGFHTAGIAAARTDNDTGVAGVDWNAQIISKRVDYGGEDRVYTAIMEAVNSGADVLNNSWGWPSGTGFHTTARLAFANAYKLNRVSVCAMDDHEYNGEPHYPAAYGQGIIAVGATDEGDHHMFWSNYGDWIDVSAPGANIWSCVPYSPYYDNWDGTSMATPFVSGLAGLLLAKNPDLDNDDIEQIIQLSADKVPDMQGHTWTEEFGYGRINAYRALEMISAPNLVCHWSATGGAEHSHTDSYTMAFYSTPGLADGVYIVKRYDVRKIVDFPFSFQSVPNAWGRGVFTNGYSAASPNFAMGWCRVVPGTATESSCTLQTYVYKVWNILGEYIGWFPCEPGEVTFAYTALGKLNPRTFVDDCGDPNNEPHLVKGEDYSFPGGGPCKTVSKDPSEVIYRYPDLIPTNTYKVYVDYYWEEEDKSGPPVRLTLWADSQELHGPHIVYPGECESVGPYTVNSSEYADGSFDLKVVNSSGRYVVVSYITVVEEINVGTQQPPDANRLPQGFSLSQNYPNPFNPSTTIHYTLPQVIGDRSKVKGSPNTFHLIPVTLRIYNILGQEVRTLVDKRQAPGYYRVRWDGRDSAGRELASGIYIYRIQAGDFSQSRRTVLLK